MHQQQHARFSVYPNSTNSRGRSDKSVRKDKAPKIRRFAWNGQQEMTKKGSEQRTEKTRARTSRKTRFLQQKAQTDSVFLFRTSATRDRRQRFGRVLK